MRTISPDGISFLGGRGTFARGPLLVRCIHLLSTNVSLVGDYDPDRLGKGLLGLTSMSNSAVTQLVVPVSAD
jgi:hypothetical protein